MKNYKIAVIPGDGTGPEVVNEGLKVLEAVSEKCNFKSSAITYWKPVQIDLYASQGTLFVMKSPGFLQKCYSVPSGSIDPAQSAGRADKCSMQTFPLTN